MSKITYLCSYFVYALLTSMPTYLYTHVNVSHLCHCSFINIYIYTGTDPETQICIE